MTNMPKEFRYHALTDWCGRHFWNSNFSGSILSVRSYQTRDTVYGNGSLDRQVWNSFNHKSVGSKFYSLYYSGSQWVVINFIEICSWITQNSTISCFWGSEIVKGPVRHKTDDDRGVSYISGTLFALFTLWNVQSEICDISPWESTIHVRIQQCSMYISSIKSG